MDDYIYKELGARIVYYRKRKGVTQESMAEAVGISCRYLSDIENGKHSGSVSLKILLKVAEKLGIKLTVLLKDL